MTSVSNPDEMAKMLNEMHQYANDPATDRSFLACKFLEALLTSDASIHRNIKDTVTYAYGMADEFIKQGSTTSSKREEE